MIQMEKRPDPDRIRRSRNIVLGLLLGGFAVLVFFISMTKMG